MHVVEVWRYPVKSLQGERLAVADIGPAGQPYDRAWGVVDRDTGCVLSAKRWPALLEASAAVREGGAAVLTLPGGERVQAGSTTADAAVAAWLDRDVTVERADPARLRAYQSNAVAHDLTSEIAEPVCPPGTFFDSTPVHLLATSSLRAAAAEYPAGRWDVLRFRPTLLVADDGMGFAEHVWAGRRLNVGADLVLDLVKPMTRCAVVQRQQPGLPRDLDIARTVLRANGNALGLSARVACPGSVREGDLVRLSD